MADRWNDAKADPIADLVMTAILRYDAKIFHGVSVDIAELALSTANDIRKVV